MNTRKAIALGFIVVAGIALLSAVAFVPWGDDSPSNTTAGVYHEGDAIDVARGDRFTIGLPANPSTGYAWDGDPGPKLKQVSSKQIRQSNLIGAPAVQEITFQAEKTGTVMLRLAYSRSFEGGVPPAKTASFSVTIGR
jgi:predicted secreted protein